MAELARWLVSTMVGAASVVLVVGTFGWSRITEMVDAKVSMGIAESMAPVMSQLAATQAQATATNLAVTTLATQVSDYITKRTDAWETQLGREGAQREALESVAQRLGAIDKRLDEVARELKDNDAASRGH
jgi:hypothetical protein